MKKSCIGLATLLGALLLTSCADDRIGYRAELDRRAMLDWIAATDKYERQERMRKNYDAHGLASTNMGPGDLGIPLNGPGFGGFDGPGFVGDPSIIGDPFGQGLFVPPLPPFFPIEEDCDRHDDDDDDNCRNCTDICCDDDRLSLTGEGESASFLNNDSNLSSGNLEIGFERPLNLLAHECGEISGNVNTRLTYLLTPENPNCDGTISDPDCSPRTSRRFDQLSCLDIDDNTAWFGGLVYEEDPDLRLSAAERAQVQQSIANGTWLEFGRIEDLESGDIRSPFLGADIVLQEGQDNAVAPVGGFGSFVSISDNARSADEVCALRDQLFEVADFAVRCKSAMPGVCPTKAAFMECEQPTPLDNGIGFANDGSFECWVNSTQIEWLNGTTGEPTGILVDNTVVNISNPPAIAVHNIANDFNWDITSGNFIISKTKAESRCDGSNDG